MANNGVLVISVTPGSLANLNGINVGDKIISINNEPVLDQINYQFLITQFDKTLITVLKSDGSKKNVLINNGGNGIGIDLSQDKIKTCKQNCIFCFVKQMPKGLRRSLYLKDEDIRLSFLYGHFTTLSSSDYDELDRIIREQLSPINISVHTTNPTVRIQIVGNLREGNILEKIDYLISGGIHMHTQVVIVPNLNDAEIWKKTVGDLWQRRSFQTTGELAGKGGVLSLSCIPVGLTSHRKHLPFIQEISQEFAYKWVKYWTNEARNYAKKNNHEPWLLLADEWYTRASVPMPSRSFYSCDWVQIENGIGMIRKFIESSRNFIYKNRVKKFTNKHLLIMTGTSFAPTLTKIINKINDKANSNLRVIPVENRLFGKSVTVAGLLCGKDLAYAAYQDKNLYNNNPKWVDAIIVPSASLKINSGPTDQYTLNNHNNWSNDARFLDDITLMDLEKDLGVPIIPSGDNFFQLLNNLQVRC